MSFGSYQQFCEQHRHNMAAGAGDAGIGFEMPASRYPTVGSSLSPRLLPANFGVTGPGVGMPPQHAGVNPSQLPSSFFTGHHPVSQPMPGTTACDINTQNCD